MDGQESTNSSVVYLSPSPGGKAERECIAPAGKGLLIPVMVVEISDKESLAQRWRIYITPQQKIKMESIVCTLM